MESFFWYVLPWEHSNLGFDPLIVIQALTSQHLILRTEQDFCFFVLILFLEDFCPLTKFIENWNICLIFQSTGILFDLFQKFAFFCVYRFLHFLFFVYKFLLSPTVKMKIIYFVCFSQCFCVWWWRNFRFPKYLIDCLWQVDECRYSQPRWFEITEFLLDVRIESF